MTQEELQEKSSVENAAACFASVADMPSVTEHALHAHHSDASVFLHALFAFVRAQRIEVVKFLPYERHVVMLGLLARKKNFEEIVALSPALYASVWSLLVIQTHGNLLAEPTSSFVYHNENFSCFVHVVQAPGPHGFVVILTIQNADEAANNLRNVGIAPHHIALLDAYVHRPGTQVLLVGPQGNVKTAMANALVHAMTTDDAHVVSFEQHPAMVVPGVNYVHIADDLRGVIAMLRRLALYDVDIAIVPAMFPHRVNAMLVHEVSALLRTGMRVVMGMTAPSLDDALSVLDYLPRDATESLMTSGTTVVVSRPQKPASLEILPLDEGLRHLFLSGASFADILATARASGLS